MGHVTMTYMNYIDTATGKTLVCVPGQSYTFAPNGGHASPIPGTPTDGRFAAGTGRETEAPADDAGEKKKLQPSG
jgi:hypothetical protein